MTGPMFYGYGFSYAVGSGGGGGSGTQNSTTAPNPLSPFPNTLKNGHRHDQDDIGTCPSIYGPTSTLTTKISTRVTSIGASLANTTAVTVTEGVWKLTPKPTETNMNEAAKEGEEEEIQGR